MTFTNDAQICHIAHGIMDLSLPKPAWTHAAHFAAAVWLVNDRGLARSEADMPDLIKKYNQATGVVNSDTDGYHETITLASLRATNAFMKPNVPGTPLFEIVNDLMASALGKPDWLLLYWSEQLLFSVEARRHWVEPDLKRLAPS